MNLTPRQRDCLRIFTLACLLGVFVPGIPLGVAKWLWIFGVTCIVVLNFSIRGPWGW